MKIVGKTMKNTIKKERLQEIAEDGFLKHGESKELARMALAAMGDEPHTDDELSNLLWYSQEATCHSDPNYYCEFQRLATPGFIAWIIRELQERRKADSEPVAYADPQSFDNFKSNGRGNAACTKEWMWRDPSDGLIPLYRHAQPAPETEREPIAWLNDAYLARGVVDGEAGSEDAGPGYIPVYREASPAQPTPSRDQVRREHAEWSQSTFGNVGPIGPLKHLRREVLETIAKPHDLIEWADMQFLLWDAQRRAGITDEQITKAMIEKLAVNKLREWPEPKDGEPRLHIKEQPVPDGFPPEEIECDICGHVSTNPEGRHHCCEDNSND